jgi:hypothetical protein
MPSRSDFRIVLTPEQERRRLVTISQAADILAVSEDTFRRQYSHLIKTISPRRRAVALGDVFDIAAGEGR